MFSSVAVSSISWIRHSGQRAKPCPFAGGTGLGRGEEVKESWWGSSLETIEAPWDRSYHLLLQNIYRSCTPCISYLPVLQPLSCVVLELFHFSPWLSLCATWCVPTEYVLTWTMAFRLIIQCKIMQLSDSRTNVEASVSLKLLKDFCKD